MGLRDGHTTLMCFGTRGVNRQINGFQWLAALTAGSQVNRVPPVLGQTANTEVEFKWPAFHRGVMIPGLCI